MIEFTQFPVEFAERYRREGYWRGEILGDLLRGWACKQGGRIALVEPDRSWTYAELDAQCDRIASGLRSLGIQAKDRLVVQLPNIASFAIVTIALFRLGAVPVFALPAHRRTEIIYLCDYSEAVGYIACDVLLDFDYRVLAREVMSTVKSLKHVIIVGIGSEFPSLNDIEATAQDLLAPLPSDVAFFLLSGGTTGLPKLIPRTHDDYSYQLRASAEGLKFDQTGVYLAALPVGHNAALGCPGLLGALRVGGKVVLPPNPSPDEVFPVIAREGVTLTTLMPPLVHLWLDAAEFYNVDFSNLLLQVGSARFAPELAKRVVSELGCRLTHWFGMAEGLLTYTRLDDPDEVLYNTVGHALCPADEIRVVDDEDHDVSVGTTGELLARGPYTLRGYYKATQHNGQAFTSDGFLRTGDLVSMTAEGNMVVQGRRKDIINKGGEKIVPAELEDLLLGHHNVREAAVVGTPDEIMGEKICAFVIPREQPLKLIEIRAFLRELGLADFKLPDKLENIASLPRTSVGKINKAKLREMRSESSQNGTSFVSPLLSSFGRKIEDF